MIAKKITSLGPSIACAALIGFGGYLIYGCYVASHETYNESIHILKQQMHSQQQIRILWVLFDVDDTLIEPASVLFRPPIVEKAENQQFLKELNPRVYAKARMPENYYWSIWRATDVPVVIEPAIINTIRSLPRT